MRGIILPLALLLCSVCLARAYEDTTLEDDDFAEFEQFEVEDDDEPPLVDFSDDDKDDITIKVGGFDSSKNLEDEIIVEDEDNEFEHFQDPEEFEGYQENLPHSAESQPKITIAKVPITVRPRWDAYWLEGIMCCMLLAYAFTYAIGRAKNAAIALNFLDIHKPLLDENFTCVGEPGSDVVVAGDRGWRREAEHCYTMWCSGRTCCEGMLLTLKLIKRQDLVHVVMGVVKPTPDTLLVRVEFGKDDSDPFVLCVAQKKIASRLSKEMQDLIVFCGEKRAGEAHGLPSALAVLSECAEAAAALLDARVAAALARHHARLQYLHVSDRYSGPKYIPDESAATKPPVTERVMLVSFVLGPEDDEEMRPLLLLVFYLIEKIKRFRLSKEALAKCEKRRQKAAEAWMRGAHAARQEQAALRREERRKLEKERLLADDDPEKHRRWELREQKRQLRRKTPKMKQLKVKAL